MFDKYFPLVMTLIRLPYFDVPLIVCLVFDVTHPIPFFDISWKEAKRNSKDF